MYLGLQNTAYDLERAFGKTPVELTGDVSGWLFKHPDFYIKVYHKPKSLNFEIQYFAWGYDHPYQVDIVEPNSLYTYATRIREIFRNMHRG